MIPEGDPDFTAYLNELLRSNKLEHQNSTFWFPTPENHGKLEDHTPIQTRILKELIELADKENLIHERAQNLEANVSNDLFRQTRF